MVNLSLKHRVKMEKSATPFDESNLGHDGKQKVLFGLSAVIALFNILFLTAGAVTVALIDRSWVQEAGEPHHFGFKDGSITTERT